LEIFGNFDENDYNYKKSKFTADILVLILNFDKTIYKKFFDLYGRREEYWLKVHKRIIFFLEEIVEEENKFNKYKEYYLKIFYKFNRFRKLLEKNEHPNKIAEEFNKKNFEWEENEEIEFSKFLELEHSKTLKKLIKENKMFSEKIEGLSSIYLIDKIIYYLDLRPFEKARMNKLTGKQTELDTKVL